MVIFKEEIEDIKNQIIQKYDPISIILFGSCAKGVAKQKSDIDICVIMNTNNKRLTLTEMLTNLEYNVDLDIIIYTSIEWNKYKDNKANFANIIRRTGVNLYG